MLGLWSDPDVHALVARASATYARRRKRLLGALEREGVTAHGASGLNVWIPVHEEAGTVGALLQRGWVLAPGASYRLAGGPRGIRVTTATLTGAEATRLARDVAEVLAPALAGRSG